MSASVTYGRLATTRSNGPFRWVARSPTVKPTTAPSRWALALATSTAGRGRAVAGARPPGGAAAGPAAVEIRQRIRYLLLGVREHPGLGASQGAGEQPPGLAPRVGKPFAGIERGGALGEEVGEGHGWRRRG